MGIGLYDTSVSLNLLTDTQPLYHAGWRLHLGTVDETRFPQVTVNLANAPASIPAAEGIDTGSRIQISNPASWLPPGNIDLLVQGYSEVIDQYTWTIDVQLFPACTVERRASGGRPGEHVCPRRHRGSALSSAVTSTGVQLDVQTTSGPGWVTAAPNFITNYDFEANLTGWTGSGSTITRALTPGKPPPFLGQWSLRIGSGRRVGVSERRIRSSRGDGWGARLHPVGLPVLRDGPQCRPEHQLVLGGQHVSPRRRTAEAVAANTWTWFPGVAARHCHGRDGERLSHGGELPAVYRRLWARHDHSAPYDHGELPQDFPSTSGWAVKSSGRRPAPEGVYDDFKVAATNAWELPTRDQAWTAGHRVRLVGNGVATARSRRPLRTPRGSPQFRHRVRTSI